MLKKIIFIFIMLISLKTHSYASVFESSGIGARPLGMSGAFTGLADDMNALYFNPAGLVNIKYNQISAMYYDMYAEGLIANSFIGGAFPYTGPGTFAMGWNRIGVKDDIILKGFSENIVSVGYGIRVIDHLSLGLSLKFLGAFYDRIKGLGYSLDAGAYYIYENFISFGLLYQDMNRPVIQWETELDEEIESNLRAGATVRPISMLLVSIDMDQIFFKRKAYHLGVEVDPLKSRQLQLRGGLVLRDKEGLSYSLGTSVKLERFMIHYALYNHSNLGFSHILGLSLEF